MVDNPAQQGFAMAGIKISSRCSRRAAPYWATEETFVGDHESDDVGRDAPMPAIRGTEIERQGSTQQP